MHLRPLAICLAWAFLSVKADTQESFLGTNSSRILFDKSWTTSSVDSNVKSSVNGSIYFFYLGEDLALHYAPPKDGNMHIWLDGNQYLDLKAAATTAPQSLLYSDLKATHLELPLGSHQIHIVGSSSSESDPALFGGFNLYVDPQEKDSQFGVPTQSNVEIIDSSAFTYSDFGWEVAAEAPFSYNSTLMRTTTKGAWVSYTFQKPYLQFWTYGTRGVQSNVQAVYPYHSGQVQSTLSAVHAEVNDTLVQNMLSSNWDWGTPGTFVNFTLEEGTLAVDFLAVIYGETPKSVNIVKIVVPVVVVGIVTLVIAAYFIIRTRKRNTTKATQQQQNKGEPYFLTGVSPSDDDFKSGEWGPRRLS